jgi:hypothetical protein
MHLGARWTGQRFILGFVGIAIVVQPVLHLYEGLGAGEQDRGHRPLSCTYC